MSGSEWWRQIDLSELPRLKKGEYLQCTSLRMDPIQGWIFMVLATMARLKGEVKPVLYSVFLESVALRTELPVDQVHQALEQMIRRQLVAVVLIGNQQHVVMTTSLADSLSGLFALELLSVETTE